jgi:hypothetical protein
VGDCAVPAVGGVPVFPVGGADGEVWPGVPEPAGGVPPAGACCATTQVAQNKSTDSSVSFLGNMISDPSSLEFSAIPFSVCGMTWFKEPIVSSVTAEAHCGYPADAVSDRRRSGSRRELCRRRLRKQFARAADKPHTAPSLPHSGTEPEYLRAPASSADNPTNTRPPGIFQTSTASIAD